MAVKKIQANPKRNKVIQRLKNRISAARIEDRKQNDVRIIDVALQSLYNEGDKITKSLQTQILEPGKIKITEKEAERIWDIMVNTGLVSSVIGFGNAGKLSLTNEGYQLMSQFGSYSAYLAEREKQQNQQGSPNMIFPQFVIEPADEQTEKGENKEEKSVGKKKEQ